MGLEQKLSLRLSQRLVMTPTLQQAIKLLQMTRLELSDVVNEELVANPVLEEREPEGEGPDEAEAAGAEVSPQPSDDPSPGEDPPAAPSVEAVEVPAGVTDQEWAFEHIDFEAFFGDYLEGSTSSAPRMEEVGEEFSLENRPETAPGLADHMDRQLALSGAPADVSEACAFLIGNLDPDGYLRTTDEEVVSCVPCSAETARKALRLLQSFDPSGVGARNLSECLLLQAAAAGSDTPLLIDLVTNRLAEVGSRPPSLLARQLGIHPDELQQALDAIRRLDPKPGRRYDSSRTIYVEPDVAVVKQDDAYVVVFNDDGLPRLRISATYRRMLSGTGPELDGEGKSYLREKIRAAQWLMKSLDQRKKTIVRVAESIVHKQQQFFEYGVPHLRPLVLRDVAEDIGMHESTVSRVVSNKWMATPRGLMPMKYFFHSAIASSGGEDVSSLAVKGKIRALVEAEDPVRPLSDARLAALLAREGIRIARRTVAKYREELHVPSSSIRRTGAEETMLSPAAVPAGEAGGEKEDS